MPIRFVTRALFLLCSLTAGCAQTASVRCWQPAEIAAGELQTLAVVGVNDEVDQRVAESLGRRIQNDGNFQVVTQQDLEAHVIPAEFRDGGSSIDRLLQSGRDADLDALVVVDVRQSEMGRTRRLWPLHSLWTGTKEPDAASVRVKFELIDTRTSEVLADREVSRAVPRTDASNRTDDEMLDRLLSECVDEFAASLAPHETESAIQLAEGEWYSLSGSAVRRGVQFARQGRWQQAEEAWKVALNRNARNDAALFNLAVASAQSGDFTAAEDFAMEALRIRHTDCYAAGLEKIRALRSDREAAELQLQTAVVPAGFMNR